jgi:hypothetical protein
MRNKYKIFVEKPELKSPLGRPRREWENSIKMKLKEMGWRVWIRFIWIRIVVGSCEHVNEPSGSING